MWETGQGPKADAVVTNKRGVAVGVGTADCGPILFADATAHVVAAAHAGWRGALGGILELTIRTMEELGATRSGSSRSSGRRSPRRTTRSARS